MCSRKLVLRSRSTLLASGKMYKSISGSVLSVVRALLYTDAQQLQYLTDFGRLELNNNEYDGHEIETCDPLFFPEISAEHYKIR